MRLIYIAGPLFAPNDWEIRQNIHRAATIGFEVAKLGHYPVIPHTNTGSVFMGTITPEFWYAGTLELLRACHAVILAPTWTDSKGAREEVIEAGRRKIPVFHGIDDLKEWRHG